ncbi:NAD(P)-dependent oxidoreductase [Puniceicoccales bacterium CK1056]|uniref:NAD(P)-dependent oxidoreductase n=1 Tax=Oceanipulchritudo coccoides TaxID=2706888 RepID=A0A6B2M198_9BACT|nr:NAD(P)-dependent oxidoreductase [Oceanipulchritudo coccoides]NDV61500.1 NAD(P)-dependent oxidoreductase [Oceanipulchritudo coccoides]
MKITPESASIGFIGLGVMGRSMAANLMKTGYQLHVHTRTRDKGQALIEAGAQWHDSPASLARVCDAIITIVGMPEDVESVYLGKDGLIANSRPRTLLIDMTTSSPALAKRIFETGQEKELACLDAPVSGGDIGARNAKLSIMVGGEEDAFNTALPLFETMGANCVRQGPAGSGQHTKMANQIAIASGMLGVCEAMAYAKQAGLDQETVLKSIGSGAAGSWSLSNLAPRMIAGDFAPGFYVKHFIKDLRIAIESAKDLGLEAPGLELAIRMYEKLAAEGGENLGTQALYRLYQG